MEKEQTVPASLSQQHLLNTLKAAGDDTRLRLLLLLGEREHNVKDLTEILGQSQPRLSRHLKVLTSAGLIERLQEGAWVYYRTRRDGPSAAISSTIYRSIDRADPVLLEDRKRAEKLIAKRAREAQAYFKSHAKNWDEIRSLYVREEKVEAAMRKLLGNRQVDLLIDLGTGTGRILELFANHYKSGLGIDISHEMLRHARARLNRLNITTAELRHGDITNLSQESETADIIIMHQILHFFSDPSQALGEAARLLKPGGQLLIVDFAPHNEEQLRRDFAHQRLGFEETQIWGWLKKAGLNQQQFKSLSPERHEANKLTDQNNTLSVSLWLAGKS